MPMRPPQRPMVGLSRCTTEALGEHNGDVEYAGDRYDAKSATCFGATTVRRIAPKITGCQDPPQGRRDMRIQRIRLR